MRAALARVEHLLEVDYVLADVAPGFQTGPLFGGEPHRVEDQPKLLSKGLQVRSQGKLRRGFLQFGVGARPSLGDYAKQG